MQNNLSWFGPKLKKVDEKILSQFIFNGNKREIEICHNTIPKQLIFLPSIIHLIVQNELI